MVVKKHMSTITLLICCMKNWRRYEGETIKVMQIKIFSKEELGFESKVNEFLKQIHETPTMSLIEEGH
jgi:hypothetical protein